MASGAISRRRLLGGAAGAAAAAWGAPTIVPSSVLGAFAPSNRIHVAFIGLGTQSNALVPAFLHQQDVQAVAVCDVNTASTGYGYRKGGGFQGGKLSGGRKPGQDRVNAYYAEKKGVGTYQGCHAFKDFREVLARDDVDAVVLAVPDHWHSIMTVMAAKAGKDIYCEKPLSLTIRDGRQMVEAVRKYKRVLQTGSMYRSRPFSRFACELIRNGRIGQVKRVLTSMEPGRGGPGPGWQPMPVLDGLDYDLWLGPAPAAPYHEDRCIYGFRFIRDYSGGQTTNFGAHCFGIVQWALDADNSGPVEFEDLGTTWPEQDDLYNVPVNANFKARYASGVELICQTKELGFTQRFEGTEGWIEVVESGPSTGLKVFPESLKTTRFGPSEVHLPVSVASRPLILAGRQVTHVFEDHARNFLDCVKSRLDPVEPVEAGHRTASVCHLANIAMRLRRKIRWDPEQEQILGDVEANQMLSRPVRDPWSA